MPLYRLPPCSFPLAYPSPQARLIFTAQNLCRLKFLLRRVPTVTSTYPIQLTGTGGDAPQTVSFSLTVIPPPPLPSGYVYITTPAGINAYAVPGQGRR